MYLTKNIKENCVMARVVRQKAMHQRNFTLKEHGSWENAIHGAMQWVDEVLPKLPPKMSVTSKGLMTSRNHSGVVGVHWHPGIVRKQNGEIYECPRWIAKWPDCLYKGGISWMERQFEHEGAFVLAVLSRQFETVNRDQILAEFESIQGTKKYEEIVSKMKM